MADNEKPEDTVEPEAPVKRKHGNAKYANDEEKRKAHIAAQMEWNSRNKDKTKIYTTRYSQKPEVMERYRVKWHEYNKELNLPENKDKKDEFLLRRRVHYANLTPEAKAEQLAKQREYWSKKRASMTEAELDEVRAKGRAKNKARTLAKKAKDENDEI